MIGSKTYSLLKRLVAPSVTRDKGYKDLVAALHTHFKPKSLVIAERFHFYRRSQAVNESVNEYMAELQRLTTHCEFGTFLDKALRDRLVCRLHQENIQKKLLTVTLARALELSVGMEAAKRNATALRNTNAAINNVATPKSTRSCYRCGRKSHRQEDCCFRNTECHNCGKRGHTATVCRSPKKGRPQQQKRAAQSNSKDHQPSVQQYVDVNDEHQNDGEDECLPLFAVRGKCDPSIV